MASWIYGDSDQQPTATFDSLTQKHRTLTELMAEMEQSIKDLEQSMLSRMRRGDVAVNQITEIPPNCKI